MQIKRDSRGIALRLRHPDRQEGREAFPGKRELVP